MTPGQTKTCWRGNTFSLGVGCFVIVCLLALLSFLSFVGGTAEVGGEYGGSRGKWNWVHDVKLRKNQY